MIFLVILLAVMSVLFIGNMTKESTEVEKSAVNETSDVPEKNEVEKEEESGEGKQNKSLLQMD